MSAPLRLTLQSQRVGNVVVIRCQGRIVTGDEVRSLQHEVEKLTLGTKNVVLHVGEVSYIDSGGLGALVRLSGVLRAGRGGLSLCQLSPFVREVLKATNLHRVFPLYDSERLAIESFSLRSRYEESASAKPMTRLVCVDASMDLLAYISALLSRAGYEVLTSSNVGDAMMLVRATRPSLVICGPGLLKNEPAIERLRALDPKRPVLLLPHDFSTSEASQSGRHLLESVLALLESPRAPGGAATA